jgi:hypothetical protein
MVCAPLGRGQERPSLASSMALRPQPRHVSWDIQAGRGPWGGTGSGRTTEARSGGATQGATQRSKGGPLPTAVWGTVAAAPMRGASQDAPEARKGPEGGWVGWHPAGGGRPGPGRSPPKGSGGPWRPLPGGPGARDASPARPAPRVVPPAGVFRQPLVSQNSIRSFHTSA